MVAILVADKEGYLRSTTSLIQTIGRAARNVHSRVIMYGDKITDSMRRAMDETMRRREIQLAYNEEHHLYAAQREKSIRNVLEISRSAHKDRKDSVQLTPQQRQMKIAVDGAGDEAGSRQSWTFERAAVLRDEILALRDGTVPDRKKQKKSSGYKGEKKENE